MVKQHKSIIALKALGLKAKEIAIFMLLFVCYSVLTFWKFISIRLKLHNTLLSGLDRKLTSLIQWIMLFFDKDRSGNLKRIDFIDLSIRNMRAKKTRAIVTIGGMSLGIAFIVFLVSIGYGLQNLVISRVTKLDELKQADILPGMTSALQLNEESLSMLKGIPSVTQIQPVIAVVGRVTYKSSISDIAVYGVTRDYLNMTGIKTTKGKFFDNNLMTTSSQDPSSLQNDATRFVEITINPGTWMRLREEPSSKSSLLGLTRASDQTITGEIVEGDSYTIPDIDNQTSNKWLKVSVKIWQNQDGEYVPVTDENNEQVTKEGYLAMINLSTTESSESVVSSVLGDTTSTGTLPLVNISSQSAATAGSGNTAINITSTSPKEAVVNSSVLAILGLNESNAIGTKVNLSFVAINETGSSENQKIESTPTEYTIVGIIPGTKTSLIYIPFVDLRSLGITNFSQIKISVDHQANLLKTRKIIESVGYGTISMVDTVEQITKLFSSFRIFLMIIGMVGLAIASLGMFNTLTVSLLERTREVGLMKAMGIKSDEIQELFLTESMMMGFLGGIFGLFAGTIAGSLLGIIVSVSTVVRGMGTVQISHVPPILAFLVIILSVVIGILTGLYPAKRATEISALDALRYE